MEIRDSSVSTRKRILETALKLFSQKGFLGATTKEIAKESGIAEITLFRHFPSKEKLFEEVLSIYSFLPVLKGILPEVSQLPFEKALTVIANKFLSTLESRKYMIQIMHSEVVRYPDKIHRIYHGFINEMIMTLASFFREQQDKGMLRVFNTEAGARAFLGMFFSYFNAKELHMMKKFRDLDTEQVVMDFVDIFARGTLK